MFIKDKKYSVSKKKFFLLWFLYAWLSFYALAPITDFGNTLSMDSGMEFGFTAIGFFFWATVFVLAVLLFKKPKELILSKQLLLYLISFQVLGGIVSVWYPVIGVYWSLVYAIVLVVVLADIFFDLHTR